MGHLMRRNILAYKAPPNNEGYDLICIHPGPRQIPQPGELAQVRVQVKSRYATDCDRGFPVKEVSLDAFDFLIVVFLNIGRFFGKDDGSSGEREPEFFTFPREFIREQTSRRYIIMAEGYVAEYRSRDRVFQEPSWVRSCRSEARRPTTSQGPRNGGRQRAIRLTRETASHEGRLNDRRA